MKVTDEAVEAARKALARRRWVVPQHDAVTQRHLREAIQAAFDVLPEKVKKVAVTSPTRSEDERIGRLYRQHGPPPPGEGTHPLQDHRDSMG